SGDARPRTADIEMTTHVMRALKLVDIKLHDHLIVAGAKCISMRSHQLI
ncbi:MAG: JAB domain-containing protein, partial [Candidatus Puniceispirillaceae bacterium]